MKTRQQILDVLKKAQPELESRFRVSRLAIFGSYARGDQRDDSDIDILVEVDPAIGLRFVDLAERIEQLLDHRIDLVSRRALNERSLNAIGPELIYV